MCHADETSSHTSVITLSSKVGPDGTVNVSTRSKDSTDCGYVVCRKEGYSDDRATTTIKGSCGT
jgi:hypothetical protein